MKRRAEGEAEWRSEAHEKRVKESPRTQGKGVALVRLPEAHEGG